MLPPLSCGVPSRGDPEVRGGWAGPQGPVIVNSPDEDFATRYRAGLWDCVWLALEKEGRRTEQYKRCQWDLTLKQLRTIV